MSEHLTSHTFSSLCLTTSENGAGAARVVVGWDVEDACVKYPIANFSFVHKLKWFMDVFLVTLRYEAIAQGRVYHQQLVG
jgi:hypothetical protein